ncbi:hypothetical protein RJ639_005900 [Escallonia herrerae]|uniref:Cytochrome P450 n=1 Tax=Escallonia herrerae TaxID=1293975 RepID=A0AA88VYR1_9ASTE|nr:hypothetical protein RJ639_005900 [Escallonia herrerae]
MPSGPHETAYGQSVVLPKRNGQRFEYVNSREASSDGNLDQSCSIANKDHAKLTVAPNDPPHLHHPLPPQAQKPPAEPIPVPPHPWPPPPPQTPALPGPTQALGPVLLLHFGSRPVLLVSSPSAAEECLTKNDLVFANRPRFLAGKYLGYNFSIVAWAPYGPHWRNLRRIASVEILSAHRLHTLQAIRADEFRLTLRRLFLNGKAAVDMKSVFFEMMLNVMMRMIAGKRCYGERAEEAEEARRFREIVTETFRVGGVTNGQIFCRC